MSTHSIRSAESTTSENRALKTAQQQLKTYLLTEKVKDIGLQKELADCREDKACVDRVTGKIATVTKLIEHDTNTGAWFYRRLDSKTGRQTTIYLKEEQRRRYTAYGGRVDDINPWGLANVADGSAI